MKKRGQLPDAYTFTLLLRGYAAHPNYSRSVERALSLYHSMSADNSPCKPSTIHTNAVLEVCARAGDLDGLFGIAAKLPQKGVGSPDNFTFTTILNAIRNVAWQDVNIPKESVESKTARRRRPIAQGRRIWADIIARWKAGQIIIDERLACAMGRLLLTGGLPKDGGDSRDFDDVLSLMEQTMKLRREIPRIGDPSRKTHLLGTGPSITPVEQETVRVAKEDRTLNDDVEPEALLNSQDSTDIDPTESSAFSTELLSTDKPADDLSSVFDPIPDSGSRIYAVPGRNTLSLVIDACIRMRAYAAAQAYWGRITSSVKPDMENYHMYLRLLRACRASALALDLLSSMLAPSHESGLGTGAEGKTFRLAMSTVVRDANNPHALRNGVHVMTMMQGALEVPDIRTGEMFIDLMDKKHRRYNIQEVKMALNALDAAFLNLKGLLAYGSWQERSEKSDISDEIPEEEERGKKAVQVRASDDTKHLTTPEFRGQVMNFASMVAHEHFRCVTDVYRDEFTVLERQKYKERAHAIMSFCRRNEPKKHNSRRRQSAGEDDANSIGYD